MKQVSGVKPLSSILTEPLVNAYKAGGYAVVFIIVGTILLLIASFFAQGIFRYIIAGIGAFTVFAVLALFYVKIIGIFKRIGKAEELINTVQETAIYVTDFAYTLQAVASKNADELSTAITQVRTTVEDVTSLPFISNFPGIEQIGNIADNPHVVKAEDLSKSIVETTTTAKTVIEDVKTALIESDAARLPQYLDRLKGIYLQVTKLLDR